MFLSLKTKILIVSIVSSLVIGIGSYSYFTRLKNNEDQTTDFVVETDSIIAINTEEKGDVTVDIKGAVVNPGVYIMKIESKINDVIIAAGGLKSNASTANINLSKSVEDEMVIIVYTKSEIKKSSNVIEVNECVCSDVEITNCITDNSSVIVSDPNKEADNGVSGSISNNKTLVSINTATKSELMNLSGIGESKAQSIIDYRDQNGGFNSIDEIKKVSGIGDSVFAQIKDYITI